MASVQKRGSSYRIVVSNGYDITGKKIVEIATYTPEPGLKGKELKVALDGFVSDFERSVKAGKNIRGERITLEVLASLYLKDMAPPQLARTTYKNYKASLEHRIIPAMGHIKIGNIRQRDVNNYKKMVRETYESRRTGKSLAESSITKDCMIISALLSYAVSEGYLDINMLIYSGRTKSRKQAQKETQVRYFTPEQMMCFIDALERPIDVLHKEHETTIKGMKYKVKDYVQTIKAPNIWRLYFYISIFTGDRRGENISLKWEDLNMNTSELTVDKSTDYVDGKMELKDTKTHNIRDNTLPQYVIEIARSWKNEQIQQSLALGDAWLGFKGKDYDKNFIFTQKDGKQMHICSPYRQYKRIIRLYNQYVVEHDTDMIPENVPPHGLRHSAAAIMIANNMDPRTVAGLLGHSDPTTTLNIYSYFFKDKGKEAADLMAQTLIPEKLKSKTVTQ